MLSLMPKSSLNLCWLIFVSSIGVTAEVFADTSAASINSQSIQVRHIQILAASCAACHGSNGNSVGGTPVLAGLDQARFVARMLEFRAALPASAVMTRHAKGLTVPEIEQLGGYFFQQARVQSPLLQPKE